MSAQLFLALIASPIATIMVVMLGVFFQNGLVDACISHLNRAMDQRFTDSVGCLETLIHAEVADPAQISPSCAPASNASTVSAASWADRGSRSGPTPPSSCSSTEGSMRMLSRRRCRKAPLDFQHELTFALDDDFRP